MKRFGLHIAFFSLLIGAFSFTTSSNKTETYIHIFRPEENVAIDESPIKTYSLSGEHLDLCNYNDLENLILAKAKAKSANAIKIHEIFHPDDNNSCYHVEASLYKLESLDKYTNEIVWKQGERLSWNDFRGRHRSHSQTVAITHSGILVNSEFYFEENRVIPKIHAVFDCKHSWVNPDHSTDEELLNHEQKHFDISEIFARKLRKKLSQQQLNTKNYEHTVKRLYNETFESLNKFQDKYDHETHHGIDKETQAKWNKIVSEELESLDDYSSN